VYRCRPSHEVRVVVAGIGRFGEFHFLTWPKFLHGAGFKRDHRREAIPIRDQGSTRNRVARHGTRFRRGSSDEAGEQVGHFLAKQHRVVIVVQAAQALEHRRQARHATQLAGFQRFEDMQHLRGRHAHQLVVTGVER
jgi:hypothetical protein